MSQQPNTILNGPSPENKVPLKDVQATQDMTKAHQNGQGFLPQQQVPTTANIQRPPLARLDSRTSLQPRLGFPNQPGVPLRPQQIRQPPPPGYQFVQRGPPTSTAAPPLNPLGPPNPAARPQGPPGQIPPNQGVRPNFRPPTPFPRPPIPGPRPPGLFQQQQSFNQPRLPTTSETIVRSQTLDSSDYIPPSDDGVKTIHNDPISIKRSMSSDDDRPKSSSSNLDGRRSISGSAENLDGKKDNDYPSRPESRASSKMNRIMEIDDDHKVKIGGVQISDSDLKIKSPILINKSEEKNDPKIKYNESSLDKDKNKTINFNVTNLELKNLTKSSSKSEGDNDSGVDESMQGNDQSSNGDHNSPRKSSGKIPSRTSSTTPTRNKSLSRESKSPSLKSPDSTATTPGATEKKKVPMNKVQVGAAPSPNLKVVKSKIGSLDNASYRPGGGKVKIESKKLDFKNAAPRIEAKNDRYAPKGGDKKIQQQKLQWNAKSKIGSLENASHKPKGGEKKIESVKLDFKDKAKAKVGSKDNMKHVPGGGDVKSDEEDNIEDIENKKIDLKVQSKVGSLDNVKYKPGGGDKKIFDDKDYLKQRSTISSENHSLSGSQAMQRPATARFGRKSLEQEDIPIPKASRLRRTKSARVKLSERAPWRF